MKTEKYDDKVMQLSAYCALQSRLLELYDPTYDNIAMLKEISPLAIKAIRKKRKRDLKSLEELSEDLDKRLSEFGKQRLDIDLSKEARELVDLLKEKEEEYKRLSNS